MKTSEAKLASSRAWKERNKERNDELIRLYNQKRSADPALRARKLEQNRQHRKRNAEKYREYDRNRDALKKYARAKIRNLIFKGILIRQPCEKCSLPNAHAHHDDYSKPLEVRWLCPKHHREAHNV